MIRANFARFGEVLRDGFRIWWLAPLIPLLVVIPEAIQHAAEIRIGLFGSREAAAELGGDPRRMIWGYLKVVGLVLAILAAVRFWATREQGLRWWSLKGVRWGMLALAIGFSLLTALPEFLLADRVEQHVAQAITLALTLATLPLFVLIVGALAGDPGASLKHAFTRGWWAALRILVFLVLTWGPLQWLHGKNHDWAFGAPDMAVWALMAFDSLVVGLLAVFAGTALHHAYALDSNRAPQGFTRS